MKIDILAFGYFKNDPLKSIFKYYQKRIPWAVTLYELSADSIKSVNTHIDHYRKNFPFTPIVALDEKGDNCTSKEMSLFFDEFQKQGVNRLAFIIGGAEGLSWHILGKATKKIAFGKLTWPHLMVRVMLIEQVYRIYQILHHHPYHRDTRIEK